MPSPDRSIVPPVRRFTLPLALLLTGGWIAAVATIGCSPSRTSGPAMPLHAHPGSCDDCHSEGRDRRPAGWKQDTAPRDATCTSGACHQAFAASARAHAPVTMGECSSCHVVHTSTSRHLLAASVPSLCAGCHDELFTCPERDRRLTSGCTTCHDPHASSAPHFLSSLLRKCFRAEVE